MPRYDGTGPQGKGPMTGRGMGNCTPKPRTNTPSSGRGTGRGPNNNPSRLRKNT